MIDLVKLHQAATHAQVEGYLLKCNGSEIRQLVDQLQAAQKDAARYQWIAKQKRIWRVLGEAYDLPSEHEGVIGLDSSIDAAMAATKGEQA